MRYEDLGWVSTREGMIWFQPPWRLARRAKRRGWLRSNHDETDAAERISGWELELEAQ